MIRDDFERDGFAVVRQAIGRIDWRLLALAWNDFAVTGRSVKFNPVAVEGPFPRALADLPSYPALLDIAEAAFGPDIALYTQRFVVKDEHARGAVFPHQDTGYHVGFARKASLFVALSPMTPENGGLIFYPGTHVYGYLGDAGEIASDLIAEHPAVSPTLEPGAAILMNSALWHGSHPHTSGPDRILADIIYQPANDPSGIELLRGQWRCQPKTFLRNRELFKRSRTSRLKELQAQVDALLLPTEARQ